MKKAVNKFRESEMTFYEASLIFQEFVKDSDSKRNSSERQCMEYVQPIEKEIHSKSRRRIVMF